LLQLDLTSPFKSYILVIVLLILDKTELTKYTLLQKNLFDENNSAT